PVFLVPELHQTFGEIEPPVKAKISHRAIALNILRSKLESLIAPHLAQT
ncbi:MAG: non-canonical purine NTP pyrophosphatase, partial [Pseudanabaena sp.]